MEVEFDRKSFQDKLANKDKMLILKFGAPWCGPCRRVEPFLSIWKDQIESNNLPIELLLVDVDDSFDVFAMLKQKKMVTSIPAILAWKKDSKEVYPDSSVIGTDEEELNHFFNWCKSNCT